MILFFYQYESGSFHGRYSDTQIVSTSGIKVWGERRTVVTKPQDSMQGPVVEVAHEVS